MKNNQRQFAPLGARLMVLLAIIIPFLSLFVACFIMWGWGFQWVDLILLLGMYFFTAIGITVGFHRLFTHGSFETYTWIKCILTILGSMAVQTPMLKWVAMHRRHHQYSDKPNDPHSPLRGFWHAHIGWLLEVDPPNLESYITDLKQDRILSIVSNLFPLWVALGIIIPAILGGIITQSWFGVWTGLIWGGLIRIFFGHHVTWSINSACHLWGYRPYRTNDMSRNNLIFGILAMGEGWHNTHHAFPTSARHGLRWWEIDISYWIIRLLKLFGLAWNIKIHKPTFLK